MRNDRLFRVRREDAAKVRELYPDARIQTDKSNRLKEKP